MIIQTAPDGAPCLAITMAEHTAFAGQLAARFGNAGFEPLAPRAPMEYVVAHHDAGWAEYDAAPGYDPETGLPFNLVKTPVSEIVVTSRKSPDFNEAHDPFSGLISSMHSWGLYNGRYGLSDHVLLNSIPAKDRPAVDAMLAYEKQRQRRLIERLNANGDTRDRVSKPALMQNYKQLQFFDTLSLYFHMTHPEKRGVRSFHHVPRDRNRDVTVTVAPLGAGSYRLDPYPFDRDGIEISYTGRYLRPGSEDVVRKLLAVCPRSEETVRLMAA